MRGKAWVACLIVAAPGTVSASDTIASLTAEDRVTISGVVDRVTDEDTFVLRDTTGSIPVYLGPNRVPVEVGMTVTVHGIVDDDVPREIYAESLIKPDGQTITFDHSYD